MDQLICASLSHTHCWYEVGVLKVPAVYISIQCKGLRRIGGGDQKNLNVPRPSEDVVPVCISLTAGGLQCDRLPVTNPTYCNVAILPVVIEDFPISHRFSIMTFIAMQDHDSYQLIMTVQCCSHSHVLEAAHRP